MNGAAPFVDKAIAAKKAMNDLTRTQIDPI